MKYLKLVGLSCLMMLLIGCNTINKEETTSPEVQDTLMNTLEVYGNVKADKSEEIIIDFPAQIEEVYVQDGQRVKKGERLFTLDLEDYKYQILEKEKAIQIDEIERDKLKNRVNPQAAERNRLKEELAVKKEYTETGKDPDKMQLQNKLELIEKGINLAQKEYEINKELYRIGAVSEEAVAKSEQIFKTKQKDQQDLITQMNKIDTSRSLEINALYTSLEIISGELKNIDKEKLSNIDALEVKIETQKIAVERMRDKLNKSYLQGDDVVATSDDLIVYDIKGMKGSQINNMMESIVKFMHEKTMVVIGDIPEESIYLIEVGDKVDIDLTGEQPGQIEGEIQTISNRAIEKDGDTVIEVTIQIKEGIEYLKPGLTTDLLIYLSK